MTRRSGEHVSEVGVSDSSHSTLQVSAQGVHVLHFLAHSIWSESKLFLNRGHSLSYEANLCNGVFSADV